MYFDIDAPVHSLKEEDGYFNLDIVEEAGAGSTITLQNDIAQCVPRNIQT